MTKWKISDYREYYHERAGIGELDGGLTRNLAQVRASKETFDLFIENENPTKEQIKQFEINLRKDKKGG